MSLSPFISPDETLNKSQNEIKTTIDLVTALENISNENKFLRQLNSELMSQNEELKTRLTKYTNGENHKRYYEKNKEKIKQSGANYLQKLKESNPDKIKEYSKRAYENKKKRKLEASFNSNLEKEKNSNDHVYFDSLINSNNLSSFPSVLPIPTLTPSTIFPSPPPNYSYIPPQVN